VLIQRKSTFSAEQFLMIPNGVEIFDTSRYLFLLSVQGRGLCWLWFHLRIYISCFFSVIVSGDRPIYPFMRSKYCSKFNILSILFNQITRFRYPEFNTGCLIALLFLSCVLTFFPCHYVVHSSRLYIAFP
jgi:hypothetical protein